MGFVELLPGKIALIGSGTLMKIGKLSGVVTARHVWEKVSKLNEVGLYQYPSRRREIQALKEQIVHLDAVTIGSSVHEDASGPDIAFVRLPPSKVASAEIHGTFLNFQKNHEVAFAAPPADCESIDAIAGGVAEMGQKINQHGKEKTIIQEGLLNIGRAVPIADWRNGLDRLEFQPEPEPDFKLPSSYGGTSGGGCFRIYFKDNEPTSMHLLGVAFYETRKDDKADKIICHGPKSIYAVLLDEVKKRWGTEI